MFFEFLNPFAFSHYLGEQQKFLIIFQILFCFFILFKYLFLYEDFQQYRHLKAMYEKEKQVDSQKPQQEQNPWLGYSQSRITNQWQSVIFSEIFIIPLFSTFVFTIGWLIFSALLGYIW